MRIVELKAENFKRIKAVAIKPDGDIVTITGANNAGKSSVVDSIFAALQARKMLKGIPEPVRTGEKHATITLDLGDYTVVRDIEPGGKTWLKITQNDTGQPLKSPQAVIDGLLESLCIDPSAFIRLKPKEQVEILIGMVDTEHFLDDNEKLREQWYEHRTTIGRRRDGAKAVLDASEKPTVPDTKPDPEALREKINSIRLEATAFRERNALMEEKERTILTVDAQIAELQSRLDVLRADVLELAALDIKAPSENIEALEEEYAQSSLILRSFDDLDKYNEAEADYKKANVEYEGATKNLDTIKTNRDAWLGAAKLPVEGLAFDLEAPCVMYNGIPLEQASTSEQLRVGTAIAMACNPTLRVIRVSDGNCLDKQSFAMLAEMAEKNDFQLWIERVDESGEVGFYIEDGSVVSVDGKPVGKQEGSAVS